MDAERTFTLAVVAYLQDSDVLEFVTVCKTTFAILEHHRDAVNTAKLSVLLRLLAEHTGGESTAEVRALQDAEDHEYWLRHMACDWDLSD